MILPTLGKLSVAQALTAGAVASTNQIKEAAIIGLGATDIWLSIEVSTVAAASGSSSTYTFSLRIATTTALTTYKEVCSVLVGTGADGATDERLLTAGKRIAAFNIGKMLPQLIREFKAEQSLADTAFVYIGIMNTLANGNGTAQLSVNSALSITEPPTESERMITESNTGVPTIASAGSGL